MKQIKDLLIMKQIELYNHILEVVGDEFNIQFKANKYITVNVTDVAKPMLCSHLDTVNTDTVDLQATDFTVNDKKQVVLTEDSQAKCLGGDDRCGVYIALRLIEDMKNDKLSRSKYSFGFFYDEEIGGVGSYDYVESKDFNEEQHTCFIGLDRRNEHQGVPEYATYGYDNEELCSIFTNNKYIEKMGSFTDCSVLANASDRACVNLSVGYNNEHTNREYISIADMLETYYLLRGVQFRGSPYVYEIYDDYFSYKSYNDNAPLVCELCGEHSKLWNVWMEDLGDELMICESCNSFIEMENHRYNGYA